MACCQRPLGVPDDMTRTPSLAMDRTGTLLPEERDTPLPVSTGAQGSADGDDGSLPAPGTLVGSYRLLDIIGSGGMGRVYRAEHARLGKQVALKMLRQRYARHPDAVQRFFSEARAVTRIEHDNLIDVIDFIESDSEEHPPCFVMQLLRGRNLAQAIREDGPFALPRLLHVAIQITSAAAAVHEAAILHRDLKPANIFLAEHRSGHEVVKLLDFGVAKLLDDDGDSMHDTHAGAAVGTPDYMSPEQLTGSTQVDHRTDIWALGVVLYEAATGTLPYRAKSLGELIFAHLSGDPAAPNELRAERGLEPLPPNLQLLILQCLQRVAAQRPSTMRQVNERLVAIAAGCCISLPTAAPFLSETDPGLVRPPPSAPPPPARRLWVGLSFGGAALVLGGLLLLASPAEETPGTAVEGASAPRADEPAAAPRQVTLTFTSTPTGAEVHRTGEVRAVGKTPLELQVPAGAAALYFELRLAGHRPARVEVVPEESHKIETALSPTRRRPRQQTEAPVVRPAPKDKDALLDVF